MTWPYQVHALADGIILEDIFGDLLLVEVCLLKMHLILHCVCLTCLKNKVVLNSIIIVNGLRRYIATILMLTDDDCLP